MERNKDGGFVSHGRKLMGAIFMANRMTKMECMERKLFGLPASQSAFVKKVKAGMLLFLFEHEERKLYGVFEATSDGALNIVPSAFLSSGKSFPAQIHMKRIWICKPLHEEEFGDVIRDNYFTYNKFNFGLSYEQVLKLIELFSLKKINLRAHHSFPVHKKFIKGLGKSGVVKTRVNEKDASVKFCSSDQDMESDLDSTRFPGIGGHHIDNSMYKESSIRAENNKFSVQTGCQKVPHTFSELLTSNPLHSTSKSSGVLVEKFRYSRSPDGRHYNNLAGYIGDHSAAIGTSNSPLAQTAHFSRPSQPLQVNLPTSDLPSTDYLSLDVSCSHGINECLSVPASESSRANLSFTRSDHHTGLKDGKNVLPDPYNSFRSQIYRSRPGSFASIGTDFLPMQNLSNMRCHLESTEVDDGSREHQYKQSESFHNYIPLSQDVEEVEVSRLISPDKAPTGMQVNSLDDDDYLRLRPFHLGSGYADHYANAANSDPYSDAYQRRSSVFSRLSKGPAVCTQGRALRTDIGLGQLVELLSQRRNVWSTYEEEISDASALAIDPNNEPVTEERTEQPFVNFKRRSEVNKVVGEHQESSNVENGEAKCKRRKLVRPSFNEDDFINKDIWNSKNAQESSREGSDIVSGSKGRGKGVGEFGSSFGGGLEDMKEIAVQVLIPSTEGKAIGESGTSLGIVLEERTGLTPNLTDNGEKDAGGSRVFELNDSHISKPCSDVFERGDSHILTVDLEKVAETKMRNEGNRSAEMRFESGTDTVTSLKESGTLSNLLKFIAGPSSNKHDVTVKMDAAMSDGCIELFPLKSDDVRANISAATVKAEQGITEQKLDELGNEKLDLRLFGKLDH